MWRLNGLRLWPCAAAIVCAKKRPELLLSGVSQDGRWAAGAAGGGDGRQLAPGCSQLSAERKPSPTTPSNSLGNRRPACAALLLLPPPHPHHLVAG